MNIWNRWPRRTSGSLFLRCITGDEVYESNGHELSPSSCAALPSMTANLIANIDTTSLIILSPSSFVVLSLQKQNLLLLSG